MEENQTMSKIPQIDSIQELAQFWDTHDLSEFEEDLEEIKDLVFEKGTQTVMSVPLLPEQAAAVRRIAQSKGIDQAELIREWVKEKLQAS